jgi:hypothetical protein
VEHDLPGSGVLVGRKVAQKRNTHVSKYKNKTKEEKIKVVSFLFLSLLCIMRLASLLHPAFCLTM